MNRLPTTLPAVAALLVLTVGGVQAASFVTEATSVVDQVIDQGQAANSEIDAFYQDFSQTATRMVDLEARVERWKSEGYLCEQYIDCVEKYDLIYAYYGQSMAEIQQAFERHQDGILAALSRFNRIVYQGKDRLSDLRSDDLAAVPAEHRATAQRKWGAQEPQRGPAAGVSRAHHRAVQTQVACLAARPRPHQPRAQARRLYPQARDPARIDHHAT